MQVVIKVYTYVQYVQYVVNHEGESDLLLCMAGLSRLLTVLFNPVNCSPMFSW
jgi:hypothetical protein